MTDQPVLSEPFEPERHELREEPAYVFQVDRRSFLQFAGAGVLISVFAPAASGQREASGSGTLESRIHLGEDGFITILAGKVEEGQGPRTEIAMAAAEELRVPIERIRVVLADTDLVPDDGITAGSRTTPATIPAVRKAAAAARELLIQTAARRWKADPDMLELREGIVTRKGSSDALAYAGLAGSEELTKAFQSAPAPEGKLTPLKEWQTLGRPRPRIDAREFVTGSHVFPSDVQRPGMLYGCILRPPSLGATLESADLARVKELPGVVAVHDGDFAGCAAPTSWAARQAIKTLAETAQWTTKANPSSTGLFEYLKQHPASGGQPRTQTKGSVEEGLKGAARRRRAAFQVAYIQHAPMEPRAAVAEWRGSQLSVWTGTSNPFAVRDQLARAFQLPPKSVRVIVPDMGGGFGGKHTGEAAFEAARLAREAGKPVSVRWTRAEEFMWAYSRPAGLIEIEAGLDDHGKLLAWDFVNYNSGAAAIVSPYRIPHVRTRFVECDSPLRQGSYRALASTANNFARESFMDELAAAAGADPLEFRLAHLDNARLRDVLVASANRFGWRERRGKKKPGTGAGLACGTEKGSYVAACVEVSVDPATGTPRLLEICQAYECGAILNPAGLKQQVEGAIIQGLGAALREELQFENGRLLTASFARYRVPRFKDVPKIMLELLDREELEPAGAGETPIIAVAPAMANAMFEATGERVRSMPLRTQGTKG